jgi:multidrug efflux pump subunit AcrA (membrane-fusion protein)
MRKVFWFIGVIAILVIGFFAYRAYSRSQSARAAQENMQTVVLEEGSLSATIGATGIVRANQSASLDWDTSGTVDQVSLGQDHVLGQRGLFQAG